MPRVSREVVFTTHTPVPAGHDRFNADLIEEHLGPLREQLGLSHERLMALGRENPDNPYEVILHDRAGPETLAPRQCRFGSARRSIPRHVDGAVSRQGRKTPFPSDTSPMACMFPPGWRRKCSVSMTATWEPAGTSTAARRASGKASRTSTMASSGKRISA